MMPMKWKKNINLKKPKENEIKNIFLKSFHKGNNKSLFELELDTSKIPYHLLLWHIL